MLIYFFWLIIDNVLAQDRQHVKCLKKAAFVTCGLRFTNANHIL